jgi:hypothetical protein
MKTPVFELDYARNCKHSTIQVRTVKATDPLPAEPDFTCNLTDKHYTDPNAAKDGDCGKRCRLLTHGTCNVREEFPERYSTRKDHKPS